MVDTNGLKVASNVVVDFETDATLHQGALQACQQLLGWTGVDKVTEISGGITNKLWKVDPPGGCTTTPVLLRVYGKGTDFFIDRSDELKIMQAANAQGIGAQVLGCFANGRLEQWLPVRNLESREMLTPAIASAIARKLCAFHQLRVPGLPTTPTLFDTIRKWFDKALAMEFEDPTQAAQYAALCLTQRLEDFEALVVLCREIQPPVVFGHNDLLSGNVLVPREYTANADAHAPPPDVNFIDFEYSAPTYRGFDVGNHFNECAGFECKWDDYPNETQALHFAHAYLEEQMGAGVPTDGDLQRFVAEAHLFALISHVYWGVWAVLQAKWSAVDFDYLSYSQLRWSRFDDTREGAVAGARDIVQQL